MKLKNILITTSILGATAFGVWWFKFRKPSAASDEEAASQDAKSDDVPSASQVLHKLPPKKKTGSKKPSASAPAPKAAAPAPKATPANFRGKLVSTVLTKEDPEAFRGQKVFSAGNGVPIFSYNNRAVSSSDKASAKVKKGQLIGVLSKTEMNPNGGYYAVIRNTSKNKLFIVDDRTVRF